MKAWRRIDLLAVVAVCLGGLASAWAQTPEEPKPAPEPGVLAEAGPGDQPKKSAKPTPPGETSRVLPGSSQAGDRRAVPRGSRGRPLVELEIEVDGRSWGSIVIELYPERAPLTVRNFLRYVDEGYYDGTIFHRTIRGFVIQGGGYVSLAEKKTAGLHTAVRNESRRGLKNTRGTITMARKTSEPHSAIAQFFINVQDNEHLDYPQAGALGFCAFGEVVTGLEFVDRIASMRTRVSPAAQRRYERYKAAGMEVGQAERSQPYKPAMIKKAHRYDPAEYEQRISQQPETLREPVTSRQPPPQPDRATRFDGGLEESGAKQPSKKSDAPSDMPD